MKRKILVTLAGLAAVLLLVGLSTQSWADTREKAEEKFAKTVVLAKDGKVFVKNIAGDIVVKTWDRAEVKIDALKVSKAKTLEKAKEALAEVKINVSEEGNSIRVETEYPKRMKEINVSVSFDLMIPAEADAQIKSISGNVEISDMKGSAKAESISGDVVLENMSGKLRGYAVSGDVHVTKAARGLSCETVSGDVTVSGVEGDSELKSVSGDIVLDGGRGSVDAGTVSGKVTLRGVSGSKSVKAKTLSGSLMYEGEIEEDARYIMNSHSGRIALIVPASSAFDLEARTFSGSIKTDFEIKMTGTISRKKLSGTVGGGGAEVNLKTFSGNISLEKK